MKPFCFAAEETIGRICGFDADPDHAARADPPGRIELFTIEVATELGKRGHEVAVFCPRLGQLANIMFAAGVWIKPRLARIPWVPEIIHGQHHLQAMAAIGYFLQGPRHLPLSRLFSLGGAGSAASRIRTYVMMCQWMVGGLDKIQEFRATASVMPNFVNTKRFSQVRTPPDRPRRAVLFRQCRPSGKGLAKLESACRKEGLSLDKIGMAFGTQQPRPEIFLLDYDLAFAVGRSALEALACGCAVIPVIPGQAGHLITMENFAEWAYANFSPRYYASAAQVDTQWLNGELRAYSPKTAAQVTAKVQGEHALSDAVDRLEKSIAARLTTTPSRAPARTWRNCSLPRKAVAGSRRDVEGARAPSSKRSVDRATSGPDIKAVAKPYSRAVGPHRDARREICLAEGGRARVLAPASCRSRRRSIPAGRSRSPPRRCACRRCPRTSGSPARRDRRVPGRHWRARS